MDLIVPLEIRTQQRRRKERKVRKGIYPSLSFLMDLSDSSDVEGDVDIDENALLGSDDEEQPVSHRSSQQSQAEDADVLDLELHDNGGLEFSDSSASSNVSPVKVRPSVVAKTVQEIPRETQAGNGATQMADYDNGEDYHKSYDEGATDFDDEDEDEEKGARSRFHSERSTDSLSQGQSHSGAAMQIQSLGSGKPDHQQQKNWNRGGQGQGYHQHQHHQGPRGRFHGGPRPRHQNPFRPGGPPIGAPIPQQFQGPMFPEGRPGPGRFQNPSHPRVPQPSGPVPIATVRPTAPVQQMTDGGILPHPGNMMGPPDGNNMRGPPRNNRPMRHRGQFNMFRNPRPPGWRNEMMGPPQQFPPPMNMHPPGPFHHPGQMGPNMFPPQEMAMPPPGPPPFCLDGGMHPHPMDMGMPANLYPGPPPPHMVPQHAFQGNFPMAPGPNEIPPQHMPPPQNAYYPPPPQNYMQSPVPGWHPSSEPPQQWSSAPAPPNFIQPGPSGEQMSTNILPQPHFEQPSHSHIPPQRGHGPPSSHSGGTYETDKGSHYGTPMTSKLSEAKAESKYYDRREDREYDKSRSYDQRDSREREDYSRRTREWDERVVYTRSPEKIPRQQIQVATKKDEKSEELQRIREEAKKTMGLDEDYEKKLAQQKRLREEILKRKAASRGGKKVGGTDGTNISANRIANPPEHKNTPPTATQNNSKPSIYINPKAFQGNLSKFKQDLETRNAAASGADGKGISSGSLCKPRTVLRIVRDRHGNIISKSKVIVVPKQLQESRTTSA